MTLTSIDTVDDSYTKSDEADTNFGSANAIQVNGIPNQTYLRYGWIQFDLTSIPDTDVITKVDLVVETLGGGSGSNAYIDSTAASFSEGTITWNNQPAVNTEWVTDAGDWGDIDTHTTSASTSWVQNALSADWCGIRITTVNNGNFAIASDEYIYGNPAKLEITHFSPKYVRATGGNDSNDGDTWATAWATINKAATTVPDGTTVHIGFGTYSNEPASNDIAPVNIGSLGIKYLPETAVTGGGTGEVIIELN